MYATLPNFFKYATAKDLVRVGRDNDGGYLVSAKDIEASEILVGLGISDDWSFEEDFVSRNDVPILAYDASIGGKKLFRKAMQSLFDIGNVKSSITLFRKYFSYKVFFRGKHSHVKKFVGLDFGHKFISMQNIFSEITFNNIFLKIDVEGWEYRVLDALIENDNRIVGMVIEFHDCDMHLERIAEFIEKISLKIVHVHANNYAPLNPENRIPLVMEVTFSSKPILGEQLVIPHTLDMPNNKNGEEYFLNFSNSNVLNRVK